MLIDPYRPLKGERQRAFTASDPDKRRGEGAEAFQAFIIYRGLGARRTLRAAEEAWKAGQSASGIRIVSKRESVDGASLGRRKRASGRFSLWSRKYNWLARAAEWDKEVADYIAAQAKDQIEKMAARHASQAELSIDSLLRPIVAFAQAMRDPQRREAFENLSAVDLFKLSVSACTVLPKMLSAEALSRGCTIVAPGTVAGTSPQGPALWNISVYAPRRELPLPTQKDIAQMSAGEWEEAEVTRS
jgi:hypothetical protein